MESFKKNLGQLNLQDNFNNSYKNNQIIESILIIDTETTGLDERRTK